MLNNTVKLYAWYISWCYGIIENICSYTCTIVSLVLPSNIWSVQTMGNRDLVGAWHTSEAALFYLTGTVYFTLQSHFASGKKSN